MRNIVITLSLGLALALGGCGELGYIFGALFPPEVVEEVKADYPDLPGHTVAVVVRVPDEVHYTHPTAPLEISAIISQQLCATVENVNTVNPYRIDKLQREDLAWDTLPMTELADKLGADYVLFISVLELSTREPGSQNLYRGKITAECTLYDGHAAEADAQVWYCSRIASRFPEDGQFSTGDSDEPIRLETISHLAQKLAKKFYDHEIQIDGRPTEEEA